MKQKILKVFMVMLVSAMLAGCGKKEKEPEPELPTTDNLEEEDTEEAPEGMARSYLTGEWIDEDLAKMRPYAVMIGNTIDALPQYGLANADIIYEVPVEGSYTRLMAIFQDISNMEKIGSVRSCRHYFIYLAMEYDAMYTHYGQAIHAEPHLAREDVDNINGLEGVIDNLAFYRDKTRKAPHNAFTSTEGLLAATEEKEYRTEYSDTYEGHFQFAKDDENVELKNGIDAKVVSPGYFVNKSWFVYDDEEGLYYRYQFKQKHIDAATDEQLKVKNILIQYSGWDKIDENGYLNVYLFPTGTHGEGKYITNGKIIDVTWTKESDMLPTRYFDEDGNEIVLNQGKTWVCIVRSNYKDRLGIYETEEELQEARAAE